LATADLPTATNHTGLQTQGGGSYNALQVTAGAKIYLARQLDPPAAAARGLSQAVGGEPRLTYRGQRRKGAESEIRRLPSGGVSVLRRRKGSWQRRWGSDGSRLGDACGAVLKRSGWSPLVDRHHYNGGETAQSAPNSHASLHVRNG
jgi:hypothetical protein